MNAGDVEAIPTPAPVPARTDASLHPGDILAGYRIDGLLGMGGMGVVYRATQIDLNRSVALKVLASGLVGDRSRRERFRREGEHAAALDHPNIVQVYGAGESDGLMFIAMQLVQGATLGDRIARGDLSADESVRILGAVALALDAAHSAGLVHRDVKPHNVLLTPDGHPYLADFGLTKSAEAANSLTRTGMVLGTLAYIAPEQLEAGLAVPQTDVYSLTAVLFHALSGRMPYERAIDAAVMYAHIHAPPPSLREHGFDVPLELENVIGRGMAKRPEERFPAASDAIEAAQTALAQLPAQARLSRPPLASSRLPDETAPEARSRALHLPQHRRASVAGPATTGLGPTPVADEPPDAHRSTGARATQPRRRRRGRARTSALAACVTLAAPVAGFALAHDPEPARATVHAGPLSLQFASPWHSSTATSAVPGLPLHGHRSIARPGVTLHLGELASSTPGVNRLPDELRREWGPTLPRPEQVRLGTTRAVAYTGPKSSTVRRIFLIATDRGSFVIACQSMRGRAPSDAQACDGIAATARLQGANALADPPGGSGAGKLAELARSLNRTRTREQQGLNSRSPTRRAGAAAALGTAHRAAADAVARLAASELGAHPRAKLEHELRATADALDSLGNATRQRRPRPYAQARAALTRSDRQLQADFDAFGHPAS